jgi:hypothetical protein
MTRAPALLVLLAIGACTPTFQQQQERFEAVVAGAVGKPFPDEYLIGQRQPTQTTVLPSGNTRHLYKEYWVMYDINRPSCDVTVEVDSQSNKIVSASSEGPGCQMPY